VAEWLRSGLQSRLHRFDSGRRLGDSCRFGFQLGRLDRRARPQEEEFSAPSLDFLPPRRCRGCSGGVGTDASSRIVKYEYEWLSCVQNLCQIIPDETASTFKLLGSMVGLATQVDVIATDAEGKIGVASSEETDTITYNGPYYAVSESVVGGGTMTGYVSGSTYGLMADNNLTCPYACGTLYHYNPETSIELVATPKPGFSFVGWSGACSGSSPTCLLTLTSNVTVTRSSPARRPPSPGRRTPPPAYRSPRPSRGPKKASKASRGKGSQQAPRTHPKQAPMAGLPLSPAWRDSSPSMRCVATCRLR
jgi:Divergent InlB B-repeat domain